MTPGIVIAISLLIIATLLIGGYILDCREQKRWAKEAVDRIFSA